MRLLAIISCLVGLIGPMSHIMIVQNHSEHLAMVIGHALSISHCDYPTYLSFLLNRGWSLQFNLLLISFVHVLVVSCTLTYTPLTPPHPTPNPRKGEGPKYRILENEDHLRTINP